MRTFFILHNRPIIAEDMDRASKNADLYRSEKFSKKKIINPFPIEMRGTSIIDVLKDYDLIDGFFKKFKSREYYVVPIQEDMQGNQRVYQMGSNMYNPEEFWWTVTHLMTTGQVKDFFPHFIDCGLTERYVRETSSLSHLLELGFMYKQEFEQIIKDRVRNEADKFICKFTIGGALAWLESYPDYRELFLQYMGDADLGYNAPDFAKKFPEDRFDYIHHVFKNAEFAVRWIEFFPEDKDFLKDTLIKNDHNICYWVDKFPEDKKEFIEYITTEKGLRNWCREIERTGKSVYLFKKFKIIDAEMYDNGDELVKRFMLDINFLNSSDKTQIKGRWRYFIFHINLISNSEFSERIDIIKDWMMKNSVNRYIDKVFEGLYSEEGLVIENKKKAEAIGKLFVKALDKGNATSIKRIFQRLNDSKDWQKHNIFGHNPLADLSGSTKLRKVLMEDKLRRS